VGAPETAAWAASTENVQTRLFDILAYPQRGQPVLARWVEAGGLQFRRRFRGSEADRPQAPGATRAARTGGLRRRSRQSSLRGERWASTSARGTVGDLAREAARQRGLKKREVTADEVVATLAAICEPRHPQIAASTAAPRSA
jgi:hypothetical protein